MGIFIVEKIPSDNHIFSKVHNLNYYRCSSSFFWNKDIVCDLVLRSDLMTIFHCSDNCHTSEIKSWCQNLISHWLHARLWYLHCIALEIPQFCPQPSEYWQHVVAGADRLFEEAGLYWRCVIDVFAMACSDVLDLYRPEYEVGSGNQFQLSSVWHLRFDGSDCDLRFDGFEFSTFLTFPEVCQKAVYSAQSCDFNWWIIISFGTWEI